MPFSKTRVTSGPSVRPPSPANTSIANVRNGPPVSPVLFTTVLICGSLSRNTAPIKCRNASCSGERKFRCAMVPAVSKPVGVTTSLGNTRRSASSALSASYPRTSTCVVSSAFPETPASPASRPTASSPSASALRVGARRRTPPSSSRMSDVSSPPAPRSRGRCTTFRVRGRASVFLERAHEPADLAARRAHREHLQLGDEPAVRGVQGRGAADDAIARAPRGHVPACGGGADRARARARGARAAARATLGARAPPPRAPPPRPTSQWGARCRLDGSSGGGVARPSENVDCGKMKKMKKTTRVLRLPHRGDDHVVEPARAFVLADVVEALVPPVFPP